MIISSIKSTYFYDQYLKFHVSINCYQLFKITNKGSPPIYYVTEVTTSLWPNFFFIETMVSVIAFYLEKWQSEFDIFIYGKKSLQSLQNNV